MIKNIEQIDSAPFGFMMPLGISSESHRVFFNNPFIIMQNKEGTIYQFEDDSFNIIIRKTYRQKFNEWIDEIHSQRDTAF